MGFFQDLKEDLSQAVNELMPEELLTGEDNPVQKEDGVRETEEKTKLEEKKDETQETEKVSEIAIDPAELEALLGEETKKEKDKDKDAVSPDMVADIEEALSEIAQEDDEVEELEEIEEPKETDEMNEFEKMGKVAETEKKDEEMEKTLKAEMEEAARSLQPFKFTVPKEKAAEKQERKGDKKMTEATKLTGVATDETAVITAGMTINGDISSKGSIDVLGTINGNVESLGKLDIAGNINGDSKAAEIFAESANITGEVRSEGAIKIGQSSVIIGNIFATSAVIAGAVKGDIDVKGPVVLDTTAIVMGNIKSKSVQINNGAVIEGLCSQCYAEVNPTAFFDDLKKKK